MADNETLSKGTYCRAQTDLFGDSARLLIFRFCKPWLEQKRVCVAELMHSTTLQNQFVSSGAFYSNTVQKIAIAQVEVSKVPVQTRVKELYDISDGVMKTLREDLLGGKTPPHFEADKFAEYVHKIKAIAPTPFNQGIAIRKAIASYLATLTHFELKLKALIDMLDPTPGTDANVYVDMFIGDIFLSGQAVKEFLGQSANSLRDRIIELIDIYKGQYDRTDNAYATRLCKIINTTKMPISMSTIAEHVLNTLEQNNILLSSNMMEELKALSDVFEHLKWKDSYIGAEEAEHIIFMRAGWLVNAESLSIITKDVLDREEKIRKLMEVYPITPGPKNKRLIMGFIERIVDEWADRADARGGIEPTTDTLKTLGWVVRSIATTDMPDTKQEKLLGQIRKIYDNVAKRLDILHTIEKGSAGLVERTMLLMDLIKGQAFMGPDIARAKELAKQLLRDPTFLELYVKGDGKSSQDDQKKRLIELLKLFEETGISVG